VAAEPEPDHEVEVPAGEPPEGIGVWQDLDTLRALMHPLRMRAYVEAVKHPVSAKELSAVLDVPLQRMSYHVRLLAEAGLLTVVRKTPRRGAIETHYRAVATLEIDDEALTSSPELLKLWTRMVLALLNEDAEHAVDRGEGLESEIFLARAHFRVGEEGVRRLRQEVLDFYDRLAVLEQELRAEPGDDAQGLNIALMTHPGAREGGRNSPLVHQLGTDRLTIPED
jgi:DNA-binding transcriptional ArsR family regulator